MESAFGGQTLSRKGKTMNRHQQRVMLLFGLLLISVAMLGCANDNNRVAAPAYLQDLERARESIAEAERAGAAEFGSAELALARDKLREAERAADDGAVERAQTLAVEADLDADLATAVTRNQRTQALASEVRSGLQTLEGELRRGEGAGFERR
jgi:hypothetical protein